MSVTHLRTHSHANVTVNPFIYCLPVIVSVYGLSTSVPQRQQYRNVYCWYDVVASEWRWTAVKGIIHGNGLPAVAMATLASLITAYRRTRNPFKLATWFHKHSRSESIRHSRRGVLWLMICAEDRYFGILSSIRNQITPI